MPIYIYGCDENREHPRVEVAHGVNESPSYTCRECGAGMHRIPQPFRFGMQAGQIIVDWLEDNYRRKRAGKPLVNKYKVTRPDKPKPGRDFHTRRYKQ